MTALAASPDQPSISRLVASPRLIACAIGLIVLLQAHLIFIKAINWDELWHYSLITASLRGEEVPFLQTPFVPLFGWVVSLPLAPLDQVLVMRGFIACFQLVMIAGIYCAARRFASVPVALLCCLAQIGAGYAFLHGFALRADMIAAALLMSALALGLRARLHIANLALIGALVLLALLSTIKSVMWAPAFLAVLVVRRADLALRPAHAGAALIAVLAAAALFVLLGGDRAQSALFTIEASLDRVLSGGLFPLGRYLVKQALLAPIFTLLVVALAGWLARAKEPVHIRLALGLLAAPLLSVVFYRNAYPYYFAFILPPVAVALAPVIELTAKRYGALVLSAGLVLNAAFLWAMEPREPLENQRRFQTELRGVFPRPVVYIDESGMLGDYPRAVLGFASGWTLDLYHAAGEPVYAQALEQRPVPLLIANSLALSNIFADEPTGDRLLPLDEDVLRSNFVHHGSLIYVAGKTIPARANLASEYVAVPGEYRIEGAPVEIDGKAFRTGETVSLTRGSHAIANRAGQVARLRWAAAGEPLSSQITVSDLFTDY